MFIGHFAAGLAAKRAAPRASLGVYFAAGQLLDLIWPVLVLAGAEHVAVDHAATAFTPLNFISYPYSHSLMMTFIWSLLAGGIYYGLFKRVREAVVIGAVVASHWVLDWLTHRPDLPLGVSDTHKVGLGLWNSVSATIVVEGSLFLIGLFLYLRATPTKSRSAIAIFWSLVLFLLVIYAGSAFGPKPPPDATEPMIVMPAFAMWLIVVWGWWADKKRAGAPSTAEK
ncbi:MAG TPA: hypothetical protein VFV50_02610 [Bdellovibrionales bacterium]|nr:hypothetical protein [Bdellovibrionales bacterium]